jgi:hypothetical protein
MQNFNNFSKKKFFFFFFFKFSKILDNKLKRNFTRLRATYDLSKLQKTYEIKDFSLANNAESHSSTKQENERDFFFFFI